MDDFVPQPTINNAGGAAPRRLRGRYELGEKIGQGGMGQVWRAIDRTFNDREVALKMLPRELSSDPAAMRQLKSEAEALLALTHPNIVRLHTFEQDDDGLCFLVMEYVRGESLDKIIAREGPLSVARAGKWLSQVAKAIDFAHAPPRKLLHRDIKPGNILIDEHGDAKLADFGLAQTIRDITTRVTGKTSSGTPAYMSPQQMFGQDHPSNDVYSFAATMYHVFAGRPPFFKGDLVAQVRHAAPAPIEGLSARVQAAMMKGLSKEIAERPASAGGLVKLTHGDAARAGSASSGSAPIARGTGVRGAKPTTDQTPVGTPRGVDRAQATPPIAPPPHDRPNPTAPPPGPLPALGEPISVFDYPKDADVWVERVAKVLDTDDGLLDLRLPGGAGKERGAVSPFASRGHSESSSSGYTAGWLVKRITFTFVIFLVADSLLMGLPLLIAGWGWAAVGFPLSYAVLQMLMVIHGFTVAYGVWTRHVSYWLAAIATAFQVGVGVEGIVDARGDNAGIPFWISGVTFSVVFGCVFSLVHARVALMAATLLLALVSLTVTFTIRWTDLWPVAVTALVNCALLGAFTLWVTATKRRAAKFGGVP